MSQKQAKRARKALREAAAANTTEVEFKSPEPVRRVILRPKRLIEFEKVNGMKVKKQLDPNAEAQRHYKNYLNNTGKEDSPESWLQFKNYMSKFQNINY